MNPAQHRKLRPRILIVGCVFLACMIVIGGRASYLQIHKGSWLSSKAAGQYERTRQTEAKRGKILDARLREMAVSVDATSIAAYTNRMEDPDMAAAGLARVLNHDRKRLYKRLAANRGFTWIKRKAVPEEVRAVSELDLAGVDFISERGRFYPNKFLAAQILGFTGMDGNGLEGLEFYYDAQLKGVHNSFKVLKDAFGNHRVQARGEGIADTRGGNIILTIDATIQYITEESLAEAVSTARAESGMAVVMDPETGAVLAMAHYPFFNPNAFGKFDRETWRNRIATDPFEPGSTMKIFAAAAALDSGVCNANTIFYCENGAYKIGRNTVHDVKPHGWLSLQQIIKFSSNIGAVKIVEQIGPEALYETLRRFGFGEKTGIDCPGETSGLLSHWKRWSKIDAGAIAFGQGVSASALQLVRAVSAIANDGVLMSPYIVQAVTDCNGGLLESFGPREARRALSAEKARGIARIMRTVITEGGSGVNASLEGYSACGKTGTAQKVDGAGAYKKNRFVSSFIGFTPAEAPRAVILVVIDEPKGKYYGGLVAAPVFKRIATETLSYLNVPPDQKTNGHARVSQPDAGPIPESAVAVIEDGANR